MRTMRFCFVLIAAVALTSTPAWAAESARKSKATQKEEGRPHARHKKTTSERVGGTRTLYFGNLPFAATDADLENAVSPYCEVFSARIAVDRETGRSRGFGFVEVPADRAQAVIDALNGTDFGGRRLAVSEARPDSER